MDLFVCCFGDDSHQRDARHSHHCEDRRDAEAAHQVCTGSSCVSTMRVFCTSSGLRISPALRMWAPMYRNWTTPLSVIAAKRSCGQATRARPGARRALHSVSEIPSKRSLASQRVLCQKHSLSASLCHVQHQRLIQSTVWTCALTVRMREVAWFHVRTAIALWEIRLYGPV